MQGFEQASVVRQDVLPAIERARGSGVAFEGDHDGVERSGALDRGLQALGRAVEAMGRVRPRWQVMARASSAAARRGGQFGTIAHDGTGPHRRRGVVGRRGRIEDRRRSAGLLPPSLACLVSAATKARGTTASSTPAKEDGAGRAHDLDEARLVDDCHLGATGEEHLAAAPAEAVTHHMGAERSDVVGPGHRVRA